MEIELKFGLARPTTADQIEALDWTPFVLGPRHTIDQHDQFFDTPDRALSRSRHAVRLRTGGAQPVITFKGPGVVRDGLHQREEIEQPTAGPTPDQWPQAIQARLRDLIDVAQLQPLLTVQNNRRTWALQRADQVVGEVALDEGVIEARGRHQPMHELEIELKGGADSDLNVVRDLIGRQLPVQPEDRSKFERGLALLTKP